MPVPSPTSDARFVAGHAVDQEPGVLEGLAPAGDLGIGQEPRVGRVDDAAVVGRGGSRAGGS